MARESAARHEMSAAAQAAGFLIGGEPLAVDLADTIVTVTEPPSDLMVDEDACRRFWLVQAPRLPHGWTTPSLNDTRRLRDAIRDLLEAACSSRPYDPEALAVVNGASRRVSTFLEATALDVVQAVEHWSARRSSDLTLGSAARSAITLLTDESGLASLRRCANPECSMLFVNGDARRQWCTPNVCGNRARVARHYRRRRAGNGT